jgi:hypothetical protein
MGRGPSFEQAPAVAATPAETEEELEDDVLELEKQVASP